MIAILIPAYEPDAKLIRLVASIRAIDRMVPIVVVDDGSGEVHADVFAAVAGLGCDVVAHRLNRGKGYALKRGFAHVAERYPQHDVVCADCDGQHAVADILRVGAMVREHRGAIVLGTRQFARDVPAHSRFGNGLTRIVFRLVTGTDLSDTQTGLRAYPAWLLGWLRGIDGDRFEYELEVLLAARRLGLEFVQVPIETIYIAGNESSHFDPIRDSIRVYVPFVRFCASSLVAFGIDTALFFALMATRADLALSVVVARLVSGTFNFVANRRLVFGGDHRGHLVGAGRYASLAVAVLAANYALLHALIDTVGVPVVPAKLLTESALFIAGYLVQKRFVFSRVERRQQLAGTHGELSGDVQGSSEMAQVG